MTQKASDGWDAALERHGVTFTALMEAMGQRLADGDDSWLPRPVIDDARRLDRQRYSRRQRGSASTDEPDD